MSAEVRALEPKVLWDHFADLNAVPRPSKMEERVIQFMKDFGENLGLETMVDGVGNVIIRKPASAGMENRKTIVLQSHLDMVHQKNSSTDFDFMTQGIEMFIEGDWVKANGTTLGADNGIGVATIMAVLASDSIEHPPMEALFTIDEETGMTGAAGLEGGILEAEIMLNLDTEEDDELTIGCAGGIDVTGTGNYTEEATPAGMAGYKLTLKGLTGGHSGTEIHLGRGNANKLMNRMLYRLTKECGVRIAKIDGGSLRNAIPRESFAEVAVPGDQIAAFEAIVAECEAAYKGEYSTTDPDLVLLTEAQDTPSKVAEEDFAGKMVRVLYACPSGIYRLSPDIDDLVQTSNNLARVSVGNGEYSWQCLTRSSVDTEKMDLANAIRATFELADANVVTDGTYPGWEPRPGSDIVTLMKALYKERYGSDAHVAACHAGLECGILGTNYPEMEMISFGPTIRGAHSPDEKVQISSVQKYWGFFLETLKRIPAK